MPAFKTVRGMRDLLPQEARMMSYIEARARKVADLYGYQEIVTPIVESYELLAVKAGEEVRSRMFVFKDLGGRDVALRPEFTASVARLVATTLRNEPKPLRLFSMGTLYRYDEPQRGRYREFWQSNYELMGSPNPEADAEILLLTDSLLKGIGLKNYRFKIGHVGVLRGVFGQEKLDENAQSAAMQLMDKKQYEEALGMVEKAGLSKKSLETLRKLIAVKGSKVFDVAEEMKNCVEGYGKAVDAVQNLSDILTLVSETGCKIDMTVDAGFARGLEYYTGMISELYVPDLNIALGGGGRYDRLIGLFGGAATPAVGIAHGLDRIMLALQEQKTTPENRKEKTVMIVSTSDRLRGEALKIAQVLREADVRVEMEVMRRKMSKALEDADRKEIDYLVIVGERELREGAVAVRNLRTREQKTTKLENIVKTIKE